MQIIATKKNREHRKSLLSINYFVQILIEFEISARIIIANVLNHTSKRLSIIR
jgi:hypothetical protein